MSAQVSAANEINEIFSAKKNGTASVSAKLPSSGPSQSEPPTPTAPNSTKKKKKKIPKASDGRGSDAQSASEKQSSVAVELDKRVRKGPPKQRQIPETIVDPSIALSKKRKRGEGDGKDSQSSNVIPLDDDLAKFVDSRGTGPRRRTEEGYLIYKEDELGIRESGGDTPLCPFDCHCCF